MSSTQKFFTIILTLIALVLIGLKQTDSDEFLPDPDNSQPTYQSQQMVTLAYEPTGLLGYQLISEDVKHFTESKETWFSKPFMTVFGKNAEPIWTVKADQAKLTQDRQLYLYDNIQIDNLDVNPQIKQINAQDAHINLITQDITSDHEVTLKGPFFSSTGLKLKGNLRDKTAELIENVETTYTPQAQK